MDSVNVSGPYSGHIAYGGTQTSGGSYKFGNNAYYVAGHGGFGYGANAPTCSSGGGSGYYGGGTVFTAGGGGGSSFAAGWSGCDTTYSSYHRGINGSQIVFESVTFQQGVNTGNGKAKITFTSEI